MQNGERRSLLAVSGLALFAGVYFFDGKDAPIGDFNAHRLVSPFLGETVFYEDRFSRVRSEDSCGGIIDVPGAVACFDPLAYKSRIAFHANLSFPAPK
jgi:hypothetical protein